MKSITQWKGLPLFALMGFSALVSAQSQSPAQNQSPVQNQSPASNVSDAQQHVLDLIERVTPGYSSQFVLEIMPATQEGEDQFEIASKDGKVLLRGNNPIALSSAYYWYLKYNCKVQLSWFGDQLNLPDQLPLPDKVESRTIQGKHRVNFNYCTLSYSAPWWTWERWEREIDMMAMNGINMPLQAIGLDAVWYETLIEMGFSDEEARGFLALPAYQAWQWMTNLEGHGGEEALPMNWIERHKELAKKIYQRQLELGMQPIQQAFTGYVPRLLKEKFPNARIAKQVNWCGFEGVAMLDPLDPLFKEMGAVFLKKQKELFGAHGYYAADPFHENAPPSSEKDYLAKVGQAIYDVVKESDPKAKIVMQSWSIRRPIAEQIPKDSLLILCLKGDKTDFWGYDFVVGRIHNWGGRSFMRGDMPHMASNPYAKAHAKTPQAVGSGFFMEGIMQNPAYYALAYEMPMHKGEIDPAKWLEAYTERAYGASSENAKKAWLILLDSIYGKDTESIHQGSIIASRPAINVTRTGQYCPTLELPYDEQKLYKAQELLLADAEKLQDSVLYQFDVVDLQRQIMSNLAQRIHRAAMLAYNKKDVENFQLHSERFLELMLDMDTMLSSRSEMNFDQWIYDARSWGDVPDEQNLYEKNATQLVTFWGFSEGLACQLQDYSWREWSGLIRRYYHPRWVQFFDKLSDSLKTGKLYKNKSIPMVGGQQIFRSKELYNDLADWEINFANTPKMDIDPSPQCDSIEKAQELFKKYSLLNNEYLTK